MIDESWKNEYKQWKDLKPYQVKLIDEGPISQSQAWLLNSMWCEWEDLRKTMDNKLKLSGINNYSSNDPWEG
tara:strand:+ start:241 stop:456 length:216 start_codon:yes stop_codon:yes gene_type:complete